jgi:hypothetical protein
MASFDFASSFSAKSLKLGWLLPWAFLSKYESGERRLDLLELQLVCRALDVSLVSFVKRFDDASKAS